ncbi:carbon-nitrogen hydrolase family protein [Paenibacillus whitsoniae]|uniref:Carbon-nitrogen hydrolase family protein n=1 Tax=Paenibacillus whitsoniae TaxID=2496558 RepID=A0A430J7L1_9BACL|nr:carbon-nitrogen hydrolase family protein [Paenibacillus whitsoniae]RTE05523.1 carbon-nitrogen hydrolase family protein [Paenibacillus whitsoniae]
MARYITISCLGPSPLALQADVPPNEAVEQMINHWQRQLDRVLPDQPDIIVLPEVCDRPSKATYPKAQRMAYYEARGTRLRDFLAGVAARHRCYITYPAHVQMADGTWRNSVQLIDRNGGSAGVYNKNYLVPDEYTEGGILYGKEAPIVETDFGRVAAAICFDLNFNELRRQYEAARPDLILFPSMYHGGLMQGYWAYSCRAYFAGAIAGLPCTIVSPLGETLAQSTNYYPFITTRVNLDAAVLHIDYNGEFFPAIKKKYGPKVRIHDPGYLGAVLLTSETEDFTVEDLISEFKLEQIDDYFARAAQQRCEPGRMEP